MSLVAVVFPCDPFHLTCPDFVWVMNWYCLRETGITLAGLDPRAIIPRIEWQELVTALVRYVSYLESATNASSRPGVLAYGVLSAVRALATIETGRVSSKSSAAEYGRHRLPQFAWLIDEAEACR